MKNITISIIILSFISTTNIFAMIPVWAPGVEGNQVEEAAYSLQQDIQQNLKELKKLTNMASELSKLQTQIENLKTLNNTAMDTYHKAEHMVTEHGDWKDIDLNKITGSISRIPDQKVNTTQSIFKDIKASPEKVADKTEILSNYYNKIDAKYWTQTEKTPKEKLTLFMVVADKFNAYEEFRIKLHGGKDPQTGEESDGLLKKLSDDLDTAKKDLKTAKNDTEAKVYFEVVKQIEDHIDYLLNEEIQLKNDYDVAVKATDQSKKVEDIITDNRKRLAYQKTLEDDTVRVPAQKTILEALKEQEESAL